MIPDKIPVLFILLDYTNYLNKLIIFVFQKIRSNYKDTFNL